jgi:SNF2 family DNA or RNA helicase
VEFAIASERAKGSILNMGMGTGKSLCVLEVAKRLRAKRILIVGPKATVSENAWGSQFSRHGNGRFRPTLLRKGNARRKAEDSQHNIMRAGVAGQIAVNVINYETARLKEFAAVAAQANYDLVVYDESHKIKGPRAKASLFCNRLSAGVRSRGGRTLLLTGTLMPHSPLDVYAQMRAVDPALFGNSFVRFRARYAKMGGFEGRQVVGFQHLEEMQELLARYVYRVSSAVLQYDEPLVSTVLVDLPPSARRIYQEMVQNLAADVGGGVVTASNGLVRLLRLQQFTSGFAKLDDLEADGGLVPIHTAKHDALVEVMEGTMEEPMVVFGVFRSDLRTVKSASQALGRPCFELSGSANTLEEWTALSNQRLNPAPVIAVQINSGGAGIDLTPAGIAVYLSTGFNGGDFEQSTFRLNRPGRQPVVRFIHIEAADTIDQTVRRVLHLRENLVSEVLSILTRN